MFHSYLLQHRRFQTNLRNRFEHNHLMHALHGDGEELLNRLANELLPGRAHPKAPVVKAMPAVPPQPNRPAPVPSQGNSRSGRARSRSPTRVRPAIQNCATCGSLEIWPRQTYHCCCPSGHKWRPAEGMVCALIRHLMPPIARAGSHMTSSGKITIRTVSYTHQTLPTTPYV